MSDCAVMSVSVPVARGPLSARVALSFARWRVLRQSWRWVEAGTAGMAAQRAVAVGERRADPAGFVSAEGWNSHDLMKLAIHNKKGVKQVIDLKGPLKGKGETLAQWRSDAVDRLAQVYRDMAVLAAESKTVEGRQWSLNVYILRDSRQLRWRMTDSRHATWARIEPLMKSLPPGLVRWYTQADEVAQILNHREQVIRYEANTVERLMNRKLRVPRAYVGDKGRGVGGGRPPARKITTVPKITMKK